MSQIRACLAAVMSRRSRRSTPNAANIAVQNATMKNTIPGARVFIALGASTPLYHLWWAVMPDVKKTRAPGMVFFIVAFCTAMFAAFGVDRLERRDMTAARHA